MIGNTVKYSYEKYTGNGFYEISGVGLVVDAYTEVSGHVSGYSESILGFGSGSVNGSTNSKRKYVVEETIVDKKFYKEIPSYAIKEILQFAKMVTLDEKIIIQNL